ncbi:ATP synthase complex subunit H-domain-containing protein [Lobosporangium transversale]|uniref:ATP synthase complex subunit H-domain-containing protein n=1 Tax=Lobosporangium transversale TaxID=64571 RepID=A0A1Y2GBE0_9FUNG|nr:ATP synthase complex subunit H-domain-containing protein [Lobosporangium transversale]ORZ05158.1 ATP synthase complex subunit H-domain-containing protein [Lobosporangium transversale]|eukprot:XP_021876933.1 ATP synthase complex subunit H-domain-containing protein [Lobosporangium transversale]
MIASRFIRLAAPVSRAVAARPAAFMAVRSFTSPSAPSQDILKDLYIKELKGYKPAPETKGADASSQVKEFKTPATPAAPAVDASADLAAWETANAEIADAVSEEAVEEAEEEEVEEEEEEHHH